MRGILFSIILFLFLFLFSYSAIGSENKRNLNTCFSGKYPALCKYNLLTQDQKVQVVKAEKRENYKTCITGKYPTLCRNNLLTQDQKVQVVKAEKRENYKTCITGKYPTLCKNNLLTQEQKIQVVKAEKNENYKICLSGNYQSLCKEYLLTQEQKVEITKGNNAMPLASSPRTTALPISRTNKPAKTFTESKVYNDNPGIEKYTCSELSRSQAYSLMSSGHNYLDRDGDGHPCEWGKNSGSSYYSNCHSVSGYYRSNGTYVSGYTRCR